MTYAHDFSVFRMGVGNQTIRQAIFINCKAMITGGVKGTGDIDERARAVMNDWRDLPVHDFFGLNYASTKGLTNGLQA